MDRRGPPTRPPRDDRRLDGGAERHPGVVGEAELALQHFAYLESADLRGTQLEELDYGYAGVRGQSDAFTTPANGCIVEGASIECNR